MSDGWKKACEHVARGELESTATLTLAIDEHGPVTEPHAGKVMTMRLCAFCAGKSAAGFCAELGERS